MEHASERSQPLRTVPPLDSRLTDLRPLLVIGTSLWLVAFVVLLLTGIGGQWMWVSAAGVGLGLVGAGVSEWQRAAARRGSRGAQTVFAHDPENPAL